MDLSSEQPKIINDEEKSETKTRKRSADKITIKHSKKVKIVETPKGLATNPYDNETPNGKPISKIDIQQTSKSQPMVANSPKKRLELTKPSIEHNGNKEKFIYGNYRQYYGYRNNNKAFHDVRLDVFAEQKEIFRGKQILDIGCNNGFITMEVAKQFDVKSIVGLDIDKTLIKQAIKILTKCKKVLPMDNDLKRLNKYPFNTTFVHGNYILKDDVLLEIEVAQFDVILCLSITKWIHLNFGDKGLKQAFRRMFLQLKSQGKLILEAQPFDNYGKRKKLTDTIFENYKNIKFLPKDFAEYLLSPEVGFSRMELMGVPDHCQKGFKRSIEIFFKD